MNYSELNTNFPSQKKATSEKSTAWRKQCVDAGEAECLWKNEGLRTSIHNKRINYNLYSDILDPNDVEKICNPLGILGLNAPAKMQNYPICNPKIDLLVGESINRRFDFKVKVVNDDAISEKENALRDQLSNLIASHVKSKDITEEQMNKELDKFHSYMTFEYQDSKEKVATHILSYLSKNLRLDQLFAKGFKDALICSEEIYQCDIIGGEPIVKRLNPLNVHTVRSGESNQIEDSDIIAIVGYMSPGQIIDEYHDELTSAEISQIERGMNVTGAQKGIDIGRKPDIALKPDSYVDVTALSGNFAYGSPLDNDGNIRVVKIYWKSMRKIKKVKFYDEFGDPQEQLMDENYKIDASKGETEKILWISEWWEGHKIGGSLGDVEAPAIYCKMRPRPIQFRKLENPSKCSPGIVGTIYNTNDNIGVSLMDRMKPLQYLYNVLAYNAELAISKNYGKIMRINLAEIPENWQVDQWLSFAQGMNAAFYDPFKEGNKGAAQGKLAGSMNSQAPVIDMEMGNTIQLYMNMMAYIKQELGEIVGVSAARQGQIANRQAVGNVQQEITQTSHITEYWFMEHDQTKLRVLESLLETAKYAWRDKKNKKVQYVLDDGAMMMLEIDGETLDTEMGLQISDGRTYAELLQSMKQLAHAGIQNGLLNFSQLLDIYSTESISTIRRKIVRAEDEKREMEQKAAEEKRQMQEEALKAAALEKEKDRDFTREEWDRDDANQDADREVKLEIERMRQDNVTSRYGDESPFDSQAELAKLRLQAEKISGDNRAKEAAHKETVRSNKVKEEQKEKEIAIKKRTSGKPKQ